MASVMTLLTEHWMLKRPDLVVSVIGGYQQFRMNNRRQREIFNQGLINVSLN
jgi:hypothetical protein